MVVKSLLKVFPYEAEIGLGDAPSFDSMEYTERVSEALEWLVMEGCVQNNDWKITRLVGNACAIIGFTKPKPALQFKLTWS